jgi:tocopherol cyclase
MSFKIYRSECFQGNLRKKKYFEGWYFKHVSEDLNNVYSLIPGISLNKEDPHSFIQVINGINGTSQYISYPLDKFSWKKNELYIRVGDSVFTDKFIDINIADEQIAISGKIEYAGTVPFPKKLLSPGIMGWYSFVPFMECKHGIVSANHELNGSLSVNNETINFTGGKGYSEKDWGTSFPEAWLWIQANNFEDRDSSFSFSIAKIPWLGSFFIGFIAFLYHKKKFYLFSTYNNSEISEINHSADSITLVLKNKNSTLKIISQKSTFGELRAPLSGSMSRRIKESIDSVVGIYLFDSNGTLICEDISRRAGLEVIEKIFDYIK